ncbi:PREDICTED: kinesin-related protein 4-like isoform X2 [Polistes dominula]|uniref:Kinesin-related protein 4-like isoform X2 n=1 Tax=Polistes dominula TaxID=743375 RepID=A0ABM1JFC6_POLDO|nr:PREDICTED: kinesin-related protein 4-like isoform X2 [Polistes dominula]
MADRRIDSRTTIYTINLDSFEEYYQNMSDQKKRTSSNVEMINQMEKEESDENQPKSEDAMIMVDSETPMLEDEEMPTYISVSTSSKCEDSDVSNVKHHEEDSPTKEQSGSPCNSEQEGPASVYVLSSEEETDQHYDEDDVDCGDSDDIDENDHDNDMDDDEEEDLEEDDDEEYQRNIFETSSECLGLRSKLKRRYRDKSQSLQDLNTLENNSCNLGFRKNRFNSKIFVENKVKRYINDIKEQQRYSIETGIRNEYQNELETDRNCTDVTVGDVQLKGVIPNKVIRPYAERAIKDLEIEESYTNEKDLYMRPITENGEEEEEEEEEEDDDDDDEEIVIKHKRDGKSINMGIREKEFLNTEKQNEKLNGSIQINVHNHNYNQSINQKNLKYTNETLVNGHQQQLNVYNLRTLSYDEYMHGNENFSQDEQLNKNLNNEQNENNDIQAYSDIDVINTVETDNSNAVCSLKIENVKSIRVMSEESKDNTDNSKFGKMNEESNKSNSDIMQLTLLKTQLDQKTIQFNNLKEVYQSTLMENLKMKQELEELKNSLAKYNKENRTCETKVVAVQTDVIEESVTQNKETTDTKETANKLSASSIISTASSINQWTDSTGSSGISLKPPDLGTILNSEDNSVIAENSPRKVNRPLSQAFITSSRILKTLSNLTQGKSKLDPKSSLNHSSIKRSSGSEESNGSIIAGSNTFTVKSPFNAKKRKATEMLDFKPSDNYSDVKLDTQKNRMNNISRSASPTTIDDKNDKAEDIENENSNVKCFVYQEDENTNDRSILIQAEVPSDEPASMGCIRECGPYLLGNVEVRMSEVNGTINIWGKEISETSMVEEEELEATRSPCINKKCACLLNTAITPHRKFKGSQIVSSTNKKVKLQSKFNEGHTSNQYLNVPDAKMYVDNLLSPSIPASCEKCILLNQQKECSIHKRHVNNLHEKSHSCCLHSIEHLERDYKYVCDCERLKCNNDSRNYIKDGCCTENKFPSRNTSDSKKDLYENTNSVDDKEVICKHRTTSRRSSLHNTEANFQNDMKCCNTIRETSHTCKSMLGCIANHDNCDENFCNHNPADNNDDILIPERTRETPEVRQRRSSGKKVRGILMDLLKSCGDYRNGTPSSSKRCSSNEKDTSHLINCSPQINVTSSCSPEAGYSNAQQSNRRCCHAYTRRIESQLEEFRMEMERVRLRSDAILNLLNMLHSVEMN